MKKEEIMKNEIEIVKELDKMFTFSDDEKDLIKQSLDKLQKDKEYELLKRKFYHELEGFDLDIAILEHKLSNNSKRYRSMIKDLKKEKQLLIDSTGFMFGYEEDCK